MREFFEKFFKDKKNVILLVLIGLAIVSTLISSVLEVFMPISCIFFGLVCIYGAYLFFIHYIKIKNTHLDEFINDEDKFKKAKTKLSDSENKITVMLLTGLFFIMGIMLIYYGISAFA